MAEANAFYASLGRRLQDLRIGQGLTQQQLGSRLEPPVTRASIANIEAGKQGVLAHTLVQLAKALNASAERLLQDETVPGAASALRAQVQTELATKLSVPPEASKRLAAKLLGNPKPRRTKDERSARARRRGATR